MTARAEWEPDTLPEVPAPFLAIHRDVHAAVLRELRVAREQRDDAVRALCASRERAEADVQLAWRLIVDDDARPVFEHVKASAHRAARKVRRRRFAALFDWLGTPLARLILVCCFVLLGAALTVWAVGR